MTDNTAARLLEREPGEKLPRGSARALDGRDVPLRGMPRREAVAVLVRHPGCEACDAHLDDLRGSAKDFALWDGAVVTIEGADRAGHLIADRYGEIYEVETADDHRLPTADELIEWFRYLSTQCPECGVLDESGAGAWAAD